MNFFFLLLKTILRNKSSFKTSKTNFSYENLMKLVKIMPNQLKCGDPPKLLRISLRFKILLNALRLHLNKRFYANNLDIMKEMSIFCHVKLLKKNI